MFFRVFLVLIALGFSSAAQALELPKPNAAHRIAGGNGVALAVQEWGNPEGPAIILLHAWSQSHLGWLPVVDGTLAKSHHLITFDHRGHGNSEKPMVREQYNNGDVWADDLNAVITELGLKDVTLVGWSYGSFVIADYVKKYGQDKVTAINFVGGLSAMGVERAQKYFGPATQVMGGTFSEDLATQASAMIGAADMMFSPETPASPEMRVLQFGATMVVPPFVRQAMAQRQIDFKETYESFRVPVLFTHGDEDAGVLPIAAEEGLSFVKDGTLSMYPGARHAPHWDDKVRFSLELEALVQEGLRK